MSYFESKGEEEWARRKSYLLRRLFGDELMLSTISEENESIAQYSPSISAKHFETRRPDDDPDSPLPELIIEIVPRRPKIYYDEPEEFYRYLEKEMRKLYRRDYLLIETTSSSDENIESLSNPKIYEFENNIDHNCESNYEKTCLEDSVDGKDLSIDEEEYDENDPNNTIDLFSQTITKSDIKKSLQSSSFNSQEFQTAMILEKENVTSDTPPENQSIENSKIQNESTNSTLVLSSGVENITETSCEESEEQEKSFMLAENNDTSSVNSDSCSTIPEPDIMRRRETQGSYFSLPSPHSEKLRREILEFQRKSLSMELNLDVPADKVTTEKEIADAEKSPDIIIINASSTPKSSQKSFVFRSSCKKNLNRFEPYSPVRSTLIRQQKSNRAQQTSFSLDESDNESLWRNLFVGTPKFFKLC